MENLPVSTSENVLVPDTPEINPTPDGVDAYAERIRVPPLSRIYSEYAHPRRLLVHPYRAVSPAKGVSKVIVLRGLAGSC